MQNGEAIVVLLQELRTGRFAEASKPEAVRAKGVDQRAEYSTIRSLEIPEKFGFGELRSGVDQPLAGPRRIS